MKFKEMKNKSETDLHKILADSRERVRELRFKVASKQLKNVREIRETKKTIARVLGLLKQKAGKVSARNVSHSDAGGDKATQPLVINKEKKESEVKK